MQSTATSSSMIDAQFRTAFSISIGTIGSQDDFFVGALLTNSTEPSARALPEHVTTGGFFGEVASALEQWLRAGGTVSSTGSSVNKLWATGVPASVVLTEHQQQRLSGMISYLRKGRDADLITEGTMRKATEFVRHVMTEVAGADAPDAVFGDEGDVSMTWDSSTLHARADLFPDGRLEYFLRDRMSGGIWSGEEQSITLPERFLHALQGIHQKRAQPSARS